MELDPRALLLVLLRRVRVQVRELLCLARLLLGLAPWGELRLLRLFRLPRERRQPLLPLLSGLSSMLLQMRVSSLGSRWTLSRQELLCSGTAR